MSKRLLIAATVLLGVGLTTSMFAVMLGIGDKMQAELSSFGANISVAPKGTAVVSKMCDVEGATVAGYIDQDEIPNLKTIFWGYNIEYSTPFLVTVAKAGGAEIEVVGTWFDHEMSIKTGEELTTGIAEMRDWWEVTGSWPQTESQAMVGARPARNQGWSEEQQRLQSGRSTTG